MWHGGVWRITVGSSDGQIAVLGDIVANSGGQTQRKEDITYILTAILSGIRKIKYNERRNAAGVFIGSRNDTPSRKGMRGR